MNNTTPITTAIEEACNNMFEEGLLPSTVNLHPDTMKLLCNEFYSDRYDRLVTNITAMFTQQGQVSFVEDDAIPVGEVRVE